MENDNKTIESEKKGELEHQENHQSEHDIEALKERYKQMNKLAEIGQLTAGILHEIQNPLNFVNNFSKLSIDEMFFIIGGQGGSGCGATVTSACSFTGGI